MVSRLCAFLLMAYILAYAILSLNGRYEPEFVGLAGVKSYAWAPYGFYDADHAWKGSLYARQHPEERTGGWRNSIIMVFGPLWIVDIHFIHCTGFSGGEHGNATQPSVYGSPPRKSYGKNTH